MKKCVLGLGTNMGDRMFNLASAQNAVDLLPGTSVIKASETYITPAWGKTDQPDFYNRNLLIQTELSPNALLGACLGIEAALGRIRTVKWGERCIDIDLLIYQDVVMQSDELTLPHPFMLKRAFVLVPMLDLFSNGNALGVDFADSLKALDTKDIRILQNQQ